MRALGELLLVLLLVVAFGLGRATVHTAPHPSYHVPSVGGTYVPSGLHCTEDSVIGFVRQSVGPYPLGCVHNEGGRLEP